MPSVSTLLDSLTLDEKISLVHGAADPQGNATGYLPGVERLGIPALRLTDGPLGIRTPKPATAFPSPLALAATFDPDLAEAFGAALAREAKARDQNVVLAPGLNLIRVPHGGRTFGPVDLPWNDRVAAVLAQWYPGQAHGDAIAPVLYGDVDPSGRLPVTFAPEGAYPTVATHRFPGTGDCAVYDEGLRVGYRGFDATETEPTYPFGHGCSYTTFAYDDAQVASGAVAVRVENTGPRDGTEVVQVYVSSPNVDDGLERPPRVLAGFRSVALAAGDAKTVTVPLHAQALKRYDRDDGWTLDPGPCTVHVGRSSRDLRASVSVPRYDLLRE